MIHYENYQTEFKGKESYTEVVGEIQNIKNQLMMIVQNEMVV